MTDTNRRSLRSIEGEEQTDFPQTGTKRRSLHSTKGEELNDFPHIKKLLKPKKTDTNRRSPCSTEDKEQTDFTHNQKLLKPNKMTWNNQDVMIYRVESSHYADKDLQFVIYIPVDSAVTWHKPSADGQGRQPSRCPGDTGSTRRSRGPDEDRVKPESGERASKSSNKSDDFQSTKISKRSHGSVLGRRCVEDDSEVADDARGSNNSGSLETDGKKSPIGSNVSNESENAFKKKATQEFSLNSYGSKSRSSKLSRELLKTSSRRRSRDTDDMEEESRNKRPKRSLESGDDKDRPKQTSGSPRHSGDDKQPSEEAYLGETKNWWDGWWSTETEGTRDHDDEDDAEDDDADDVDEDKDEDEGGSPRSTNAPNTNPMSKSVRFQPRTTVRPIPYTSNLR